VIRSRQFERMLQPPAGVIIKQRTDLFEVQVIAFT
jgi:hypothetical protein